MEEQLELPFDACWDEYDAMEILSRGGWKHIKGVYYHPDFREETPLETKALNYLCGEWDYASTNNPEEVAKLLDKKEKT